MSSRRGGHRPSLEGAALDSLEPLRLPPDLVVESIEVDGEAFVVFSFATEQGTLGPLTDAEREVVALILQGLTTAQIAATRGVARATVSSQLQSIYRKLGVASRAELACKLG